MGVALRSMGGEVSEEDLGRAWFYGLLARFLSAPPDAALLKTCAEYPDGTSSIQQAIGALAAAAADANVAALDDEFHALFIGMGRGELVPFASYYLTGFLNEKPLAELRDDMARLGIERASDVHEPEDHAGALCDMMAGLIHGHFGAPMSLPEQATFFNRHMASWAGRFFSDLETAKTARFYRTIGTIGRLLMEIEVDAFQMLGHEAEKKGA